ncbi:hypothetical protein NG798_12605 [Ancylothrix sp. C2]|uniref:hypothetical protein n=1 Tax=Ancylothrix sp. D3o TaxID=2953691 RepID=UPI0021BB70A4|nr:hypothetical protein [Ancylothrix sp. D3o]MCT7950634.1 hypothetical protein [Ancylothrix sp. D3o]
MGKFFRDLGRTDAKFSSGVAKRDTLNTTQLKRHQSSDAWRRLAGNSDLWGVWDGKEFDFAG